LKKIRVAISIHLTINSETDIDACLRFIQNQLLPDFFKTLSTGQTIYKSNLFSVLGSTPGLKHINKIELCREDEENKNCNKDWIKIRNRNEILVLGSTHIELSRQ